jgi:hypothetical protein
VKLTNFSIVIILIFTFVSISFSQETEKTQPEYGWKKELIGNLNFTQNNFDNWSQGGENSWSWQLDINVKFVNDQEKYNWSNSGKCSFGKTKIGDVEARKAADEIKLESVYTYKFGVYVNPYIAATGKTQFTKGYIYDNNFKKAVSNFMDPAYFTESIGVGYAPNDKIKSRLGAALKETITSDFPYADDPTTTDKIEKTKVEIGAESTTDINLKLSETILFTSKLELFSNLERVDEIDVNWDNLFSAKISKYISVSLNVCLFYDKDISKKRQLKETLAVGLSYSFL